VPIDNFFRITGKMILYLGVILAVVGIAVPHYRGIRVPPSGYCRFALFILGMLIFGVGLLQLRRWAAAGASLCLIYAAYISAWGAGSFWLGYALALLLVIPACMTAAFWRSTIWRNNKTDRAD